MSLIYKPLVKKSAQICVSVTPEMHAAIMSAAETANVTASELVRNAIARGVPLYLDAVRKAAKSGGTSGGKTHRKRAGKRGV